VLFVIFAAVIFCRSRQFLDIDANKVLLQLNRKFNDCEESAQLILQPNTSLSTLQQLQKARIQHVVERLLLTDLRPDLPKYSSTLPLALSVMTILIFLLIQAFPLNRLFHTESTPPAIEPLQTHVKNFIIEAPHISISSPKYTGLELQSTTDLNLSLIVGSRVTWEIQIHPSNLQNAPLLVIGDEPPIDFSKQNDNLYQASAQITHSAVYHIAGDDQMLSDIHTLTVIPDTRPNIRFIAPTETITEIAKNAPAALQTRVLIEDDFGLGRIEILASIASGSGEAVKFRDQTFQFDSQAMVDGKTHFLKNWDLTQQDMQPGDELYFSIRAWDNRQPSPQQSRSANKIVRWLEDEEQSIMADGVLFDFLPEYFKSQRQIIIETTQLIADKSNMSIEVFNRTSEDLGAAQSDLKQKYGQFLGDEFESGTLHSMEAGPDLEHEQDHHEDHEDEALQTSSEHAHDTPDNPTENSDKSGYSQLIEQFGHAHGEADDGNFIKKGTPNPKLLMKRAIGNMWQAELHLLLSQPEQALVFENKALALLNRAKKAERIYVKRLGFEPPPVSERRRYQGDLSDILSYQRSESSPNKDNTLQAIKVLLNALNHKPELLPATTLTTEQINNLQQTKAYFSAQLTHNPQDISIVATLEKIQQTNSFNLVNCQDCIKQLRQRLWQALPVTIAQPVTRQTGYSANNPMLQSYRTFLQRQEQVNQQ
jgi:hypothetical protein